MDRSQMDAIPELALDWHRAGRGAAIATVIETWGSAPRQAGSQLVVSGEGAMMGSVSGGCVEGAVVEEARAALLDGAPRMLSFGVSDDNAFAVGLACGGTIRILVEPVGEALPVALLEALVAARAARQSIGYQVNLESWARQLVGSDADPERFRADKSGVEAGVFLGIHNPPLRLVVVGAVHVAQALIPMARACGYDPLLIDPREAFGASARFPGETISHEWPDAAMQKAGIDLRSAVVTLTHDPKLDDPAIATALRSEAFYIGCLGSTRTHAKRIARLTEAGFTEADIARIHGPVGLRIGAKSPAEIAVSIMAELTQRLRQG
ncbi:MAG: XdhC family protein [Albidovulum sp.]